MYINKGYKEYNDQDNKSIQTEAINLPKNQ